jgi:hypothetical protein
LLKTLQKVIVSTFTFQLSLFVFKPRFHGRANPSCSSGKHIAASKKSAYSSPAGELHMTLKNGKQQAARWICTTVETRI